MENHYTIDYGRVNLKQLILTTDKNLYEKVKAQENVGVLFEPKVLPELEGELPPIYLVGILDKEKYSCNYFISILDPQKFLEKLKPTSHKVQKGGENVDNLKKRIKELEKKVAELEGQAPAQREKISLSEIVARGSEELDRDMKHAGEAIHQIILRTLSYDIVINV